MRCAECGVEILDETERCPLCQHVLEQGEKGRFVYPNARVYVSRFRFFENLIFFLSILIESVLVGVNLSLDPDFLWSVIVGLALIYVNVLLRLAVVGQSGYQFKTISMIVFAMILLTGIDYLTGYRGWAVDYVVPAGILLMDLMIFIVMMINFRNYQSYMMVQLLMILMSILSIVLIRIGIGTTYRLAIIALGVSAALFLGTLILGDKRARNEMKRRFHV